ncbi:Gcv operon activator [Delftia tsuruhatensis]|uniref:LysR family transcriptional regulator n=1 Tax=Delftia tsuruhatensis TaxID=180282 RepID=UPI001E752995|nr:LysR family transcriptional regulator [Delftia tsuruhatensis]CAB5704153.1 Gcv operon activator [Delftia tsuruhatensis]CAC9684199.1 Gcv operon activator [Delftia tsuruhatensis]
MPASLRLPPLSALRAFEATVRCGSVSKAARELHLTDGAVSRAVRELEASVGFALFERAHRAVQPTPAARMLAKDVQGALERLHDALARARRSGRLDRPLVLSCEPTLLMRWLIPRLGDLQDALGADRELRLVAAGGRVAFAREGIDLAIRRADFPISDDVRAEAFLDERVGPVCRTELAPALAGPGPVTGVLLHAQTRPEAWAQWAQAAGVRLQPARELRFEHFYLSLQAATAGAGIAIGPIALVADDIANGVLCAPRGFVADGTCYVLLAPAGDHDAGTFDAVLSWLRSSLGRL